MQAAGDLTLDANTTETINAVVVAAAIGNAGSTAGVAVSGSGSYAENRIKTDVNAYIDGDGSNVETDGIEAGSVTINAQDSSSINAIAGAASLSVGFGAPRASRSGSGYRLASTRSETTFRRTSAMPTRASPLPTATSPSPH